ncbi:ral GTPase-activating protein subunit beta-like isoform X4 [Pomacea canaliculata]|uniref:ral GTPase-activating protein subunit beta-like isoform X4 n=1 Tax=Pomacea canaliculata TaxID=400727 RepID=UPI000D73203C|nr:ral GTPase-activating protein subunit beta-like isoform X4 [Pomacea canaliculata]
MYADWASLQDEIQCDRGNQSVLHRFPQTVGREVSCAVVKCIAHSLSSTVGSDDPSMLEDERDVRWTMEVLCFGLGLPLTEHETINDCVKVYVEWLMALTTPKPCVPKSVVQDPNPFTQVILHHLLNLFRPRPESGVDLVKRQALLCHRVLRAIEAVAKESTTMTRDTWETLLKFLLAANDSLLSPPTEKDDISDHLCERVLSVLFGVWLTACSKCFPSPSLWKTFRNMCMYWRHHEALVLQWHKVNLILTAQMIRIMYGLDYPQLIISEEDNQIIPTDMSQECIAQAWFRFLHIVQNPVDLSRPAVVSNTPRFLQHTLTNETLLDPSQHPCLMKLPTIFHRAMRGVSIMVNAFLGLTQDLKDETLMSTAQTSSRIPATTPSTPPGQRKSAKPMSVLTGSLTAKVTSKTSQVTKSVVPPPVSQTVQGKIALESRFPFAPTRPKCNSILHLFGSWLFDAALAGVKLHPSHAAPGIVSKERRTSSFIESKQQSLSMDLSAYHPYESDNTYEAGRAEACGALCRIFCAHKTKEHILPVYYTRFYLVMYYGLQTAEPDISGEVLTSILFNSCDLLRTDLAGVQILTPYILKALELVLSRTSPEFRLSEQISYIELRKACVHLLLSMVCLPLHFKDLQIKDILSTTTALCKEQPISFLSLKNRIIDLLRIALTNETDATNTQMLLGGFMLVVQDLATSEETDSMNLQPGQETSDSDANPEPRASTSSADSGPHDTMTSLNRLSIPSKELETAYGLFGHATSLVCNRLMASWKTDLNTALAAMELLAGLAKVTLHPPNILMCKRTVKWICDFIVYQCSRPAPNHSRDLHSLIVAAFKCVQLWLVEHSSLLYDKECLHYVLEVVELGISGSKSQDKPQESQSVKAKVEKDAKSVAAKNRASDPPRYKGTKQLMPASMRVKDAAEAVLTCIIDQVGAFPPPCGPESLFSLLDERSLLKYAKGSALPEQGSPFRYFVIDNSIIVGLLEQPLGNVEDPLPTVTALIRGAFGRHAWTMQLRHSPRASKISSRAHLADPGRPLPFADVGVHHNVKHRYFPECVEKITKTKADLSIPSLESLSNEHEREDLEKMKSFIDASAAFEKNIAEKARKARETTSYPDPMTECKPPKICNEYQTARLFLSHYGFLSLESLKEPSNCVYTVPPALVMLDSSNTALFSDLESLDFIPSRDNDTVHVFYVKQNQKTAQEILNNVTSCNNVQPQFLEFLHSLGWPVDVRKHAGWTGHVSTSWKIIEPDDCEDEEYLVGTGGSLYDGRQQVLYWADVLSELAFVVPSPETFRLRTMSSSTLESDKSGLSMLNTSSSANSSPHVSGVGGAGNAMTTSSPNASPLASHSPHTNASPRLSSSAPHSSPLSLGDPNFLKPKSLTLEGEKLRRLEGESPGSPPESGNTSTAAGNTSQFRRLGRQPAAMMGPDTKVLVVWLESFQDTEHFPTAELLSVTSTGQDVAVMSSSSSMQKQAEKDVYIIFIHSLQNGLFRIHIQEYEKTQTKMSVAIPLVDGMVVSRRTLGTLVRQTAINICRRRRLESEAYQPPHVRRKLKIQEIVNKYRCSLSPAEFYTALCQEVIH